MRWVGGGVRRAPSVAGGDVPLRSSGCGCLEGRPDETICIIMPIDKFTRPAACPYLGLFAPTWRVLPQVGRCSGNVVGCSRSARSRWQCGGLSPSSECDRFPSPAFARSLDLCGSMVFRTRGDGTERLTGRPCRAGQIVLVTPRQAMLCSRRGVCERYGCAWCALIQKCIRA